MLLIGSAGLDMVGRVLFSGVVGRAEGRLRADLLEAATAQPLTVLEDQAVGELIDRVDDDTRQLAHLFRRAGWETGRAVMRSVLGWVVAGFVWWPAWIAFPLVAVLVVLVARPLTARIARCKAEEEAAWSDHSAQLEEAVAGQDDVRTALGQSHVVRAYADRAHAVLERVRGPAGSRRRSACAPGSSSTRCWPASRWPGWPSCPAAGRAWPSSSRCGCWSPRSSARWTRSSTACRRSRPVSARWPGSARCCPPSGSPTAAAPCRTARRRCGCAG